MLIYYLLFAILYFKEIRSICEQAQNCSMCLKISSQCVWCQDVQREGSRCIDEQQSSDCSKLQYRKSKITITDPNTEAEFGGKPKIISLILSPETEFNSEFHFIPNPSSPLDVYHLQDFSESMRDDIEAITTNFKQYADLLRERPDSWLGFGGFIDKPIPPIIFYYMNVNRNPRNIFSFKNFANVSSNIDDTKRHLDQSNILGNADDDESQFDALMQVAACHTIGWRKDSRKIIIIATDAPVKFSGNGKTLGIMKNNDGRCHLENNRDTQEILQDFPSLSQIKDVLLKGNFSVIFMVTETLMAYYKDIVEYLKDTNSVVAMVDNQSKNFIQVFRNSIETITNRLILSETPHPLLNVSYELFCNSLDKSSKVIDNSRMCTNINIHNSIKVKAYFKINTCMISDWNEYSLFITSIGDIKIKYKSGCDCDCEDVPPEKSSNCSSHGQLKCGICYCDDGYSGTNCECKSEVIETEKCINPKEQTKIICSGNGKCTCGKCECNYITGQNQRYTGDFCQCSKSHCGMFEEQECGGSQRGACICNECQCNDSYTGPNCGKINCDSNIIKAQCGMENNLECEGHGKCVCGECLCDKGYYGTRCHLLDFNTDLCTQFQNCVECYLQENNDVNKDCNNCQREVKIEMLVEEINLPCSFIINNGCNIMFSVGKGNVVTLKKINTKLDCPKKINTKIIIFSVIVAAFVISLILFYGYFIILYLYEKRRYEKYTKINGRFAGKMEMNPIHYE